jgi:16S rRNA (cytosine967-C5)-methyltransferase
LVNAVLRAFLRRRSSLLAEIETDDTLRSAHPTWLLRRLQADWPSEWPAVVAAGNARPPQSLRVNLSRISRQQYLERLHAADIAAIPCPHTGSAIVLAAACDVESLPGFTEGLLSIQDCAAQIAAGLLELEPGLRLLDACAAPGGKICHALEVESRLDYVLALDRDAVRLQRLRSGLARLHLDAHVIAGDALTPATWWDGTGFDRILLDVPCSGTGVIRRHPDIKVLRRATDIEELAAAQCLLLKRLWPLLVPDGMLVYSTCSILKQENEAVIGRFINEHADACQKPIPAQWGI